MLASAPIDCPAFDSAEGGTSNTPLNQHSAPLPSSPLEISVDWLTFSLPIHSLVDVDRHVHYLRHILNDEFSLTPGRSASVTKGVVYSNTGRSTRGTSLKWNLPHESKDGKGRLLIQINGTSLRPLNFLERIDIVMTLLLEPDSRVTRIDLALDDYTRKITFEQLYEAQEKDNYSGFNISGISSSKTRGKARGNTYYFGSRHSGYFLRIYDKAVETDGEINAIRFELEAKQGRSEQIGALIYNSVGYSEQQLKKLFVDLITGSIDFIERRHDTTNLDRMKRLQWWQEFLDFVASSPLKFQLPKPERTLEKSRNWLNRQVASTLAMLHEVYGENQYSQIMRKLLQDGRSRFDSYHKAIIKQGQKLNLVPIPANSQTHTHTSPPHAEHRGGSVEHTSSFIPVT
jgi:Replication initiation factor